MKKMIFACLALAFAASVMTAAGGCRAEGEIDPDGNVNYVGGLAR